MNENPAKKLELKQEAVRDLTQGQNADVGQARFAPSYTDPHCMGTVSPPCSMIRRANN
jgi:hypothetical protein